MGIYKFLYISNIHKMMRKNTKDNNHYDIPDEIKLKTDNSKETKKKDAHLL
ncbi:hypothetical protein JGI3_02230 [Candidatus Kryptobacter tengchongensis]|nr:hypothetical protein JGI3_02230 [Candidatus Kryptobacter tengchongensis]